MNLSSYSTRIDMATLKRTEPGPESGNAGFSARKLPRQRRSRTTVESIKQATLALLSEHGLQGFGTDRIAERAGVSIGSLYQYFPNREAILQAVYEDVSIEYAEAMRSLLDQIMDLPIEAAVTRVIDRVMRLHERHQLVLLTMAEEIPELNLAGLPLSFNNLLRGSIRAYVINKRRLSPRELDRKVFLIEKLILGSAGSYLREKPTRIARREFTADMAQIIARYIES